MNKKVLIISLVLLILGVSGYLYINRENSTPSQILESSSNTTDIINIDNKARSPFNSLDHNSLSINSQKLTDIKNYGLAVNDVYFEKSGFIIISDIKNDEPNNVVPNDLGLFESGRVYENIAITTSIEKGTYFGQLYEDDGDRVFNKQKDKILPLYDKTCSCYNEKFVVQFSVE